MNTPFLDLQAQYKSIKHEIDPAIQNVVDDMVVKGKKYQQFSFDKVVINLMRTMIQEQQRLSMSNSEKNITIIKAAMAKLL